MSVNICVQPEKVWSFFYKNIDRLSDEMVVVAENEDTQYAVYLTEDSGYPLFCVCRGDAGPEYEEGAINEKDCADTAKRCYFSYLFPVCVNTEKSYPEQHEGKEDKTDEHEVDDSLTMTEQDMLDIIYERDDELQLALCDFLSVVLGEYRDGTDVQSQYSPSTINEILDHFLEYLADEYGTPVYRPMLMKDDKTGSDIYVEYPYNEDHEPG